MVALPARLLKMTVMARGSNGSWSRSGSVIVSESPHGLSLRAHFADLAIPSSFSFFCLFGCLWKGWHLSHQLSRDREPSFSEYELDQRPAGRHRL